MANQQDLDAAEATLGTEITTIVDVIANAVTKITNLIAKIGAGAPPADLANEVTALQSMVSSLSTVQTTLQAAVDAATKAGA